MLKWISLGLGLAVAGLGTMVVADRFFGPSIKQSAQEVMASETVRLIGTDRVVVRSLVEFDNSDWLRGTDHILSSGEVTLLIGIDLDQAVVSVAQNDAGREHVVITLPAPTVLSNSINEDTIIFWRDATMLHRFSDFDSTAVQSEVRKALKSEAERFARDTGQFPEPEDVEARIRTVFDDLGYRGDLVFVTSGS